MQQKGFNFYDISTWKAGDIIVGHAGFSKNTAENPIYHFVHSGYDEKPYYDLIKTQSCDPVNRPAEIVVFKILSINSEVKKVGKSEVLLIDGIYLAGPRFLYFDPWDDREYSNDAIIQVTQDKSGQVHLTSKTVNDVVCDNSFTHVNGFDRQLFDFMPLEEFDY